MRFLPRHSQYFEYFLFCFRSNYCTCKVRVVEEHLQSAIIKQRTIVCFHPSITRITNNACIETLLIQRIPHNTCFVPHSTIKLENKQKSGVVTEISNDRNSQCHPPVIMEIGRKGA